MTIRHVETGKALTETATPTGKTGVYEARVVFPSAGTWRYEIDNGLAATGYGTSQTQTYAPVEIAPGSASSSWRPATVGGIAAAVLVLGGVLVLALRRRVRAAVPAAAHE